MLLLFLLTFQLTTPSTIDAKQKLPKIVMVYMTQDHQPNSRVLFIEANFSPFAEEIVLIPSNQLNQKVIENSDVLVFIGDEKGQVPEPLLKAIETFPGKIIAFGKNVEQLEPYKDWRFLGQVYIRMLDDESLPVVLPIIDVIPPSGSDVLTMGKNMVKHYPFIINNGRLSYIATTTVDAESKFPLSRSLYTLLDQTPPTVHPAYIRLEDISPVAVPKLLKQAGDYLADRKIPFYMAVIPVYVNSETGEKIHMSENKKLVRVLQYLQERGGMVISHGYTHSYRMDETGEGFEFWDIEVNQKITTEQTEQLPPKMKQRSAFSSEELYQTYIQEINKIEERYIDTKLTKSIEDLTDLELYPLSFEAPHYAMSSSGYQVTFNYFTSIFGQVQFSDDTWELMRAPLIPSKPAILSGMTLYPETIGFIDPTLADPYETMEKEIERLKTVPGSMIGGFYHPYIGLEYLPRMVQLIESVPNMEWLDLRKTNQLTQTAHYTVRQEAGKALEVSMDLTLMDRVYKKVERNPFDFLLWTLAITVSLVIIAFFAYVLVLRTRLRKRLFKERN